LPRSGGDRQEVFVTEQNFFFDKWNREAPKFDKVMDALPHDRLDYRPAAGSRSAAEMVTHLAREQELLVRMLETGRIEYEDASARCALCGRRAPTS
jgi:hypothetical protein